MTKPLSCFSGGGAARSTSDVPAPRAADSIDVDGTIYLIQGEPLRDPERLVWTINGRRG